MADLDDHSLSSEASDLMEVTEETALRVPNKHTLIMECPYNFRGYDSAILYDCDHI